MRNDELISRHLQQAAHYMRQPNWERAIQQLQRVLALDPESGVAHTALALCLWQSEKYEAANQTADEALRLRPDEPSNFYNKGCILASLERWQEALGYLQQAVAGEPDDADNHVALGHVLLELKQLPAARAAALQAVQIEPGSAPPRLLAAAVEEALGNHDLARQLRHEARSLDPEWSEAHHQVALGEMLRGRSRASLEQMREALRLDPTNTALQHNYVIAQNAGCLFFRPLILVIALLRAIPPALSSGLVGVGLVIAFRGAYALAKHPEYDTQFRILAIGAGLLVVYFVTAIPLFQLAAVRAKLPDGQVTLGNLRMYCRANWPLKRIATAIGSGVVAVFLFGLLALLIREMIKYY